MNSECANGRPRRRASHQPRWKVEIRQRAGAVGLGCLLGLGTVIEANAYNHDNSPESSSSVAAEISSDGMAATPMEGMGRA